MTQLHLADTPPSPILSQRPPSTIVTCMCVYYARCTQLASHKLCIGSVMNTLKRDLGTGDLCDNIGLVPLLKFEEFLYPICLFTITTSMRKYEDRLFEIMHQFHCVLFASISRPSPSCPYVPHNRVKERHLLTK